MKFDLKNPVLAAVLFIAIILGVILMDNIRLCYLLGDCVPAFFNTLYDPERKYMDYTHNFFLTKFQGIRAPEEFEGILPVRANTGKFDEFMKSQGALYGTENCLIDEKDAAGPGGDIGVKVYDFLMTSYPFQARELLNYDSIFNYQVERFDKSKFSNTVSYPLPHQVTFTFTDNRFIFDFISRYYYSIKKYDDAVKLYLIIYKMAIFAANGAGGPPELIHCVESAETVRHSLGNPYFWNALADGNFDERYYLNTAGIINKMSADYPKFDTYIEIYFELLKYYASIFFTYISNERYTQWIFDFEKPALRKVTCDAIEKLENKVLDFCCKNIEEPQKFIAGVDNLIMGEFNELDKKSFFDDIVFTRSSFAKKIAAGCFFTIGERPFQTCKLADIGKYFKKFYLPSVLRTDAAKFYCKLLAYRAKNKSLPGNNEELAKLKGPVPPADRFNKNTSGLCVYKFENKVITIYSAGENGVDDGGSFDKDNFGNSKDLLLLKVKIK